MMFPPWNIKCKLQVHVRCNTTHSLLSFPAPLILFSFLERWENIARMEVCCCFVFSSLSSLLLLSFSREKCIGVCGVCGSIASLLWWVPWYGWHSFVVIWNWIRGVVEGGRDDEEYQSFCLLCEVICGSTESAIMKVHLFTTEGLWVNLLSPRREAWNKGSEPSTEEATSIQSEWFCTSVCPHNVCYDITEPRGLRCATSLGPASLCPFTFITPY